MSIPEGRNWYYGDDENGFDGPFPNRESAIAEGRHVWASDTPFVVCEALAQPSDPEDDFLFSIVAIAHKETIDPLNEGGGE
jgi:hypothetical protein